MSAIHLLAVTDERENSIPRLTAQFYRVASGFPVNVTSPDVPLATTPADVQRCLPIKTESGKTLNLWLVTIPVNPGLLQQLSCYDDPDRRYWRLNQLSARDMLEVEFTKDVAIYRMYPDPCYYSMHGAGLPSSVRLFAATVEYPAVDVRFEPDAYGNIWTEPAVPSYTISLTNRKNEQASVNLQLDSVSHSGIEKLSVSESVTLEPLQTKKVTLPLPVKRFGHHDITLQVKADGNEKVFKRSLSHLREREHDARSLDAEGFMFGFWNWRGSHGTPNADEEILLMGPLGMESTAMPMADITKLGEEAAVKYGMKDYWAFRNHAGGRSHWGGRDTFIKDPEKATADFIDELTKYLGADRNPKIFEPSYINFFGEPGGIGTYGSFPEFFGEPAKVIIARFFSTSKKRHTKGKGCIRLSPKEFMPLSVITRCFIPAFVAMNKSRNGAQRNDGKNV